MAQPLPPIVDVQQETAGVFPAPAGSNSVTLCVGFAWKPAQAGWVVGHVDSAATPRNAADPCVPKITAWMTTALAALPVPVQGTTAYITSGSGVNDVGSGAIIAALTTLFQQHGAIPDINRAMTSFYVRADGTCWRGNNDFPNADRTRGGVLVSVPPCNQLPEP